MRLERRGVQSADLNPPLGQIETVGQNGSEDQQMPKRIAINTGGGDAPGLNAVIRAATLAALNKGWEVYGGRAMWRSRRCFTSCGISSLR